MFGFINKMFITAMTFVCCNVLIPSNVLNQLTWIPMSNQKCGVKPAIVNINSNAPLFNPYSITVNKCGGSCNDLINRALIYVFLLWLKT